MTRALRGWVTALATAVAPGCAGLATNTVAVADAAPADRSVDASAPGGCATTDAAVPWRGGTWRLFDDEVTSWRPAACGAAVPLSTHGFDQGGLCRTAGRFYQTDSSTILRVTPSFSRATSVLSASIRASHPGTEVNAAVACTPAALFAAVNDGQGESALLRFDVPEETGCVLWRVHNDLSDSGGVYHLAATETFLAWAYDDSRTVTLRAADPDGGNPRVLAAGSELALLRAAGDRLVYESGGDLWLYTHALGRVERLTSTGTVRNSIDFAGDRVAWLDARDAAGVDGALEVYAMDLRDRVVTRLTTGDRGTLRGDLSTDGTWVVWIERARTALATPWQPAFRTELHGYHLGARREVPIALEPLERMATRIIDGAVYFTCEVPALAWGANDYDGGTYRLALPAADALPDWPAVVPAGTPGGRCRRASPACADGAVCNPLTETCATEAAAGAPCDPSGQRSVCAAGRPCASTGGAPACVVDHTPGGRCVTQPLTAGTCAEGLSCGPINHCVRVGRSGDACDPTWGTTQCSVDDQLACVARPSGPVCAPPGTLGAGCWLPWNSLPGTAPCDAGLACGERRLCLAVVAAGDPCDPALRLNTCARAATCAATADGPRCRRGPFTFERVAGEAFPDACALGAPLPLAERRRDETHAAAPVEIPFPFAFYGVARAAIWPSVNGYAVFGRDPPTDNTRGPLPLSVEDDVVAPLLRDLTLGDGASGLCAAVVGQAPARRLVLSWDAVRRRGHADDRLRVALVLREDGAMDFAYDALGPAGDAGAWVFVQGPPGTLPAAYDGAVTTGTTLRLRPAP